MSYRVKATDVEDLFLNETETVDEVQSILQNIALILATPKGTVPMYRNFGIDMTAIDRPLLAAKPLVCAAAKEAIEEFEPRVEVESVTVSVDPDNPGVLIPTVEVSIIGS
ncbi:MAG: GPW/gp25 family protein [Coriobacteriaceae bacterium]|nr:GPW/gp25 family protein [Coriobacteriaceae bacterium]